MKLHTCSKINIGLFVTSRRPDGYHNIETVFYPLNLGDELIIEKNDTDTARLLLEGLPIEGNMEDNLLLKTYRIFKERYGIGGIDIRLQKQVPMGAGLGGGSADAAYMAKGLNELFELGLSHQVLEEMVAQLGADCAFFIQAQPAYAEGIGNLLHPLPLQLKGYHLLLVKPDVHVSTAAAYKAITPQASGCRLGEVLLNCKVSEWKNHIRNDFEQPVFAAHPIISDIKQEMYKRGALYACMSGSGSSVFGIFASQPDTNGFEPHFVYTEAL